MYRAEQTTTGLIGQLFSQFFCFPDQAYETEKIIHFFPTWESGMFAIFAKNDVKTNQKTHFILVVRSICGFDK